MKNAVVTGGGSGIGQAIANRLRSDGYHVATLDLNPSDDEFAYTADVTDRAADRRGTERDPHPARAGHDPGQRGGPGQLQDASSTSTSKRWQRVIDVNLNGVFHCIQAVLPDMIEAGWGRIVNISSSSTHSGAPYMAPLRLGEVGRQRADQDAWLWSTDPPASPSTPCHPASSTRRCCARPQSRASSATSTRPSNSHPGAPHRQARGHRRRLRLPHLRRGRLHHRADPRRQRRPQHLTANRAYERTTSGTR